MNRANRILSLLIKILAIVAVVGIGVFVYQTCAGTPIIQRIDKMPPEKTVAPFEVSTQTHIYYCSRAFANNDGSVTMYGWYEQLNGKWVLHDKEITLPKVLRPNIGRR